MAEPRVVMEGESDMPMEIVLWLIIVSSVEYVVHMGYMVPTNSIGLYDIHYGLRSAY